MSCVQASIEDIERYLTGLLPEDEQQVFEEHYFGCAECFSRLEAVRAIQTAARTVKPSAGSGWWMRGVLGIAAALVVATGLWHWSSTKQPAASNPGVPSKLVLLAKFDAPSWTPMTLRGAGSTQSEAFRAAMQTYQAGNFPAASQQLRAVVSAQPALTEARFYLGISSIESGNRNDGIEQLKQVVAAGDTPWLEQARFYLAKALIGAGDVAGAKSQLEQVTAIRGDLAGEAQKLLDALARK